MLAPNFKSHHELGLRKAEWLALIKVLGMLERGEFQDVDDDASWYHDKDFRRIPNAFSMGSWMTCLCGWARRVSDGKAFAKGHGVGAVDKLFMRTSLRMDGAAMALRDFLTTGKP